ncbi:hypothetical protein F5877DRAFT_64428 [Lentinula edodes]|nr:hypothetical protein F5877DRAFT_64428 [Lentinula edodes]
MPKASLSSRSLDTSSQHANLPYMRTSVQRRRCLLPVEYNPDLRLSDTHSAFDPQPEACHLYMEQARLHFAEEKRLPTFDIQAGEYVKWECPFAGIDKMAIGIETNQITPPVCHHILNPHRTADWCRMSVIRRNANDPALDVVGYFTTFTHKCIWHPIHPANDRLLKFSLRARPDEDGDDNDSNENYDTNKSDFDGDSSECGHIDHDSILFPSATNERSFLSNDFRVWAGANVTSNTDQMVYTQQDLYLACSYEEGSQAADNHWVSHGPLFDKGKLRRPSSVFNGKGASLFSAEQAKERQLTDHELIRTILYSAEHGQYLDNPRSHPAYILDEVNVPPCLQGFMMAHAENIAFGRTGHLRGTPVGTAILLFNGVKGVSIEEFAELRKRNFKCISCYCYFSWDGYQKHIGYDGVCRNTPELEAVPDLSQVIARVQPFSIRPPPAGTTVVCRPAAVNAVGLAWITWNSHIGVTHDVWVHLITAWRRCGTCGMLRSFEGHLSHLKDEGLCGEVGDDDLDILGREVLSKLE